MICMWSIQCACNAMCINIKRVHVQLTQYVHTYIHIIIYLHTCRSMCACSVLWCICAHVVKNMWNKCSTEWMGMQGCTMWKIVEHEVPNIKDTSTIMCNPSLHIKAKGYMLVCLMALKTSCFHCFFAWCSPTSQFIHSFYTCNTFIQT